MKKLDFMGVPPKKVQEIFDYEWSRAKKILKLELDKIAKPILMSSNGLGADVAGQHWPMNEISVKVEGRKARKVTNVIFYNIADENDLGEIRDTIQHEICHVALNDHSKKFWALLTKLQKHDHGRKN